MKFMRSVLLTAGGCIFLLISGCSILPNPIRANTEYYDLAIPEKALQVSRGTVSVEPFISVSGDRFRMTVRQGTRITSSDSEKWIMPPGSMITKYLRLAFRQDKEKQIAGENPVIVKGEVTAFEMSGKFAMLGLNYRIIFPSQNKTPKKTFVRSVLIREPVKDLNARAFAEAMSRATEKAAEMIRKDIEAK